MDLILATMLPVNRLAVEVSLSTGLRISDVLSLKTETVQRTARPYVRDSKTGKNHRIYLTAELRTQLLAQAGSIWVFEGRLDPKKHRTRQTVYKDMEHAVAVVKRAQQVDRGKNISPHSARKCAAVRAYQRGGLEAARAMLVHDPDHPMVTMLYALSDELPSSKRCRKRKAATSKRKPQSGQE